ncbi:MAG: glycosyl transferase, partial [Dehalococcoidia bacterium]|nr:glycosyl transferase [Dehalococcoidia bacterium]
PDAVRLSLDWLDAHPDVGICGPKILLPDGRLDGPCRRSFKTPAMYFYRFLGLTKRFPKSRRFGRYYLSYLDPDLTTDVDAVIGAFLLIRRATFQQIGPLDERFFMYCEDEDWCFRAKQAGWRVVYYPKAVVEHHKGTSSQQHRARAAWYWHRSVFLHHRKHIAAGYHPLINAAVYAGIAASFAGQVTRSLAAQRR